MLKNKHGFVPAAIYLNKTINEMRKHVEYEKFVCRTIVDNETTQQFKVNTEVHRNSQHRFIYNNEHVDKLTKSGRK